MTPRRSSRRLVGVAVVVLAAMLVAAAPGNDPLLDRQYHLRRVRAPEAWEVRRGYQQVIAVLDTGVDLQHPDLKGRLVPGIDLVERGTRPDDDNGHGTFVAGIAAANLDNDEGGSGVAPRASIMPVRVLNKDGKGTSDVVAEGIRWATRNGATVINLSLADVPGQQRAATDLITTDVELAIRQAALAGVVVVCAAGNEGEKGTAYSRDLPALIVGATDKHDAVWEHSNYDDNVLFAPGVDIVSTYIGQPYAAADGTSFSAPIVSAGAAMLRQHGLDEERTRRQLQESARPIGSGYGRVDVAAALGVAPRVRSTPEPQPKRQQQDVDDGGQQDDADRKPAPIAKPSPLPDIKPRRQRQPEEPSPLASPAPEAKPRKATAPKVVKADKPKKRGNRGRQPVVAPVQSPPPAVIATAPRDNTGGSPVWPLAVAGVLLFVVTTMLAGYITARRSR